MENNTTQLKKFTPETMKEIVYVTWPTLAPAGDKAAWVDWKGDMKSGLFSSKIHLMENLLQNATGAEGMDAARKESVLTPDGSLKKNSQFFFQMAFIWRICRMRQVSFRYLLKILIQMKNARSQHFVMVYCAINCQMMRQNLFLRQRFGQRRFRKILHSKR